MKNELWLRFFNILSSTKMKLLIKFYMTNNAEFVMSMPNPREIKKTTFSSNLEFPFRFDEIEKIKILFVLNHKELFSKGEIKEMENFLRKSSDIKYNERKDGFEIYLNS